VIFKSLYRVILIIMAAVVVLYAVFQYKVQSVISEDKKVSIPHLLGKDIIEAAQVVEHLNINENLKKPLRLKVTHTSSEKYAKYVVIKQLPDPGKLFIKEGRTITLQVSSGSKVKAHIIPNYIGKPYHQVRNDINSRKVATEKSNFTQLKSNANKVLSARVDINSKLKNISALLNRQSVYIIKPIYYLAGVTFARHNKIPSGHVIKQHPAPGSYFNKDTAIYLVVSSGPERDVFRVGNYKNRSVEQIVKLLNDWNIHPKLINVPGNSQNTGQIVNQSIPMGKTLSHGDSISLSVANYSTDQLLKQYRLFRFTVPSAIAKSQQDTYKAHKLRIVLQDGKGQVVLFEGHKRIGESLAECARVTGKALVWVYINGRHYRNFTLE